jgi:hypothetical protein
MDWGEGWCVGLPLTTWFYLRRAGWSGREYPGLKLLSGWAGDEDREGGLGRWMCRGGVSSWNRNSSLDEGPQKLGFMREEGCLRAWAGSLRREVYKVGKKEGRKGSWFFLRFDVRFDLCLRDASERASEIRWDTMDGNDWLELVSLSVNITENFTSSYIYLPSYLAFLRWMEVDMSTVYTSANRGGS